MSGEVKQFIAQIPEGKPDGDPIRVAFVNFTRKSLMRRSGGKIFGSWQSSFSAACLSAFPNSIEEASVIRIQDAGRCSGSGEVVVMAEHY